MMWGRGRLGAKLRADVAKLAKHYIIFHDFSGQWAYRLANGGQARLFSGLSFPHWARPSGQFPDCTEMLAFLARSR
jgi:hypothetical protein